MNKLLSANFQRMWKNHFFHGSMIFMVLIALAVELMAYRRETKYQFDAGLEEGFFSYVFAMAILISVLCSLFIGTEYSDGTMRNKIIVGQKRKAIYLSNLLVCTAAEIILCGIYILVTLCVGTPLIGFFNCDVKAILIVGLCGLMLSIACTALFSMVAMLSKSKSNTAVICILGVFLLIFGGVYLSSCLSEPEKESSYVYMENGAVLGEEEQPNPNYLEGTKRKVYQFLYDFTPGGQIVQITEMNVTDPLRLCLYAALITAVTTGTGLYFFEKKDLN